MCVVWLLCADRTPLWANLTHQMWEINSLFCWNNTLLFQWVKSAPGITELAQGRCLTIWMKREQEEKKGEENKPSSLSSSKLLWQINHLRNHSCLCSGSVYPIPSGTKLRHIGEKSNHPGCPLRLKRWVFPKSHSALSRKCFKLLKINPIYCSTTFYSVYKAVHLWCHGAILWYCILLQLLKHFFLLYCISFQAIISLCFHARKEIITTPTTEQGMMGWTNEKNTNRR